jgi:shikimate kinase
VIRGSASASPPNREEHGSVSAVLPPRTAVPSSRTGRFQTFYNPLMPAPVSRLILTGFMGAGKSTVGAILAQRLGWRFLDLDRLIESASQCSIADIFSRHGEAEFRRRELEALQSVSREEEVVLALGGGTIEDESARDLLLHTTGNCLVYLHGELPDLLARCQKEGQTRPLLADLDALQARHTRRLPYYRSAHLTVTTTGLTPREVAAQVLALVFQIDGSGKDGSNIDG